MDTWTIVLIASVVGAVIGLLCILYMRRRIAQLRGEILMADANLGGEQFGEQWYARLRANWGPNKRWNWFVAPHLYFLHGSQDRAYQKAYELLTVF